MSTAVGEHTALNQRKKRAGQRLIVGLQGHTPSPEFRAFCKSVSPAGFILFARNVDTPVQVSELNADLSGLVRADSPALLSVDQEGGRVRRIKETPWPPMRVLGNLDDIDTTHRLIKLMSEELRSLGFNTNWAPVADVDSNPDNPVIGDRSFSPDPVKCHRHIQAALNAFHESGIIGCIKHFPGHGDTALDSHLELPTVGKDKDELMNCEFYPFRQLINDTELIMTAHVMFPVLDEVYPATMSTKIIKNLLRESWGYQRLVVSDDLEMKAVRGRWPLEEQLKQASLATVDLFLVCSELDLQWEAFEWLVKLQEQDGYQERQSIDAVNRLKGLRQRHLQKLHPRPSLSVIGSSTHKDLCDWILARGEA